MEVKKNRIIAAAAAVAILAGTGVGWATVVTPATASACTPTNAQGGGWGGTRQTCLPDGGMQICDNGWAPFVGRIENCFIAYPGHPRYVP